MAAKLIEILSQYVYPFLLATDIFNPQVSTKFKNSYDYIIVGAGSSGSVIASRLTEDPCVSVLLLEAGPEAEILTEVPGATFFTFKTSNDWQYRTVPQSRGGLGRKNTGVFDIPSGRGLGGGSLLFSPQYLRGNKLDYDRWAQNGAEGWSYAEVLPYFKKSENNTDPRVNGNGYHGTDGYVTIETLRYNSPLYETFLNAGKEMGLKFRDSNGPKVTGTSFTQGQTRFGRRCNAAKAFLIPAQNRPNLDIIIHATVSKVLINENKQAYGVKFELDGKDYEVRSNLEVILAAGTFNTPQILMLSGIGPQDHLSQLGIPVIADLPVGDNYQTHVGTAITIEMPDSIRSNFYKRVYADPQGVSNEFNYQGAGILTAFNGFEGYAFYNSKDQDPALDWPDLHSIVVDFSEKDTLYEIPGSESTVGSVDLSGSNNTSTFTVLSAYLRPGSRGTVRLASNNFRDKPIIDPNIYQHPEDLEKGIEATQRAIDLITKTKAFQAFGTKLAEKKFPGCEQYVANSTYYSPEYIRCLAIRHTFLYRTQGGTCRMGRPTDKTTVVDPQLRVKGIKNLRVCDSTVIPSLPSAGTNPASMMIGEKASDIIKADNPNRLKC